MPSPAELPLGVRESALQILAAAPRHPADFAQASASGWMLAGRLSRLKAPYAVGLSVVLAAYSAAYLWLLVISDFLPYAMDNNESFSSFWHASNMWHFGLSKTFGLTDESFSPALAAHPVVEPHNGNFPRFFSLLLYALGSRSIEPQVVITTFTVGIAVMVLAYHFFNKVGNPLFATVVLLVMLSDYVFFGQWQANTWRVWAGFFFFSTLLSIHAMESGRKRWIALAVLNAACLFYLEVVFAAFVAMLACVYALIRHRPSFARALVSCTAVGTGGVLSVAVLFVQRLAYFGLSTGMHEIYLTYFSRNEVTPGLMQQVNQFYASRPDVAFWYNVLDARSLLNFKAFVNTTFHYNLEPHTPLLTLVVLVLIGGWLLGLARVAPANGPGKEGPLVRTARRARSAFARPIQVKPWRSLDWPRKLLCAIHYALFCGACSILLMSIADGNLIRGVPTSHRVLSSGPISDAVAVLGFGVTAACLQQLASGRWMHGRRLPVGRLYLAVLLLLLSTGLVRRPGALYDAKTLPVWDTQLSAWPPVPIAQAAVTVAAAVAVAVVLVGARRLLPGRYVPAVLPFLLSGGIAYTAAYRLAAGYLVTGYLERYAPFAVYLFDCIIGLAIYVVVTILARIIQGFRAVRPPSRLVALPGLAVCSGLLVFFAGFWSHLQATWVSDLIPNQFNALRAVLQQPPYRGSSFLVNNYPALAATYTGQWAYLSTGASDITGATLRLTSAGYVRGAPSQEYVWMADRQTNASYQTPEYFLCMLPESMETLSSELAAGGGRRRCASDVARILGNSDSRLVAKDESGNDSWAIVKLNLDYPPYLAPLPQFGPTRRVGLTFQNDGSVTDIAVHYSYQQQQGEPEQGTILRLYCVLPNGNLTLLQQKTDPGPFVWPSGDIQNLTVSVTPSSTDKAGVEFFAGQDYPDSPAVEPPGGLALKSVTNTQAVVTWWPVAGASSYRIERRDRPDGQFTLDSAVTGPDLQFSSKGLQGGNVYSWRVQACVSQTCSPYSQVISTVASSSGAGLAHDVFALTDGFNPPEGSSGNWPRWTQGSASVELYPHDGGPVNVNLDLAQPTASGSLPNVTLTVNGRPVEAADEKVQLVSAGHYKLSFTASASGEVGDPLTLVIGSPTFVPAQVLPNSDDVRRLGIEIMSLEVVQDGRPLTLVDNLTFPAVDDPGANADRSS